MTFTISVPPVTKKNSNRIVKARGHYMVLPSQRFVDFEKACKDYIPSVETIDHPVNVECVYYMPTRRRVDLVNLEEATLDVLVKYKVLSDDNSNIVVSMDGSQVFYDKENPRTEITITPINCSTEGR